MTTHQFLIFSLCGFSAKGVTSSSQPGAAPQGCEDIQPSALNARLNSYEMRPYIWMLRRLNRAFSACTWLHRIPGASPQANGDIAPLALATATLAAERNQPR
jgi:hypothetical protein